MSISTEQDIFYSRYQGSLDPRLPEGSWFARGDVLGDGTGGFARVRLVFTPAAIVNRNSRLYNIEQLTLHTTNDLQENAQLLGVNFEGPRGGQLLHAYTLLVTTGGGTIPGSALASNQLTFLPLWLGTQRLVSTITTVEVEFDNVTGVIYTIEAEGFWWGARSVLADGGPQRPPASRFGP